MSNAEDADTSKHEQILGYDAISIIFSICELVLLALILYTAFKTFKKIHKNKIYVSIKLSLFILCLSIIIASILKITASILFQFSNGNPLQIIKTVEMIQFLYGICYIVSLASTYYLYYKRSTITFNSTIYEYSKCVKCLLIFLLILLAFIWLFGVVGYIIFNNKNAANLISLSFFIYIIGIISLIIIFIGKIKKSLINHYQSSNTSSNHQQMVDMVRKLIVLVSVTLLSSITAPFVTAMYAIFWSRFLEYFAGFMATSDMFVNLFCIYLSIDLSLDTTEYNKYCSKYDKLCRTCCSFIFIGNKDSINLSDQIKTQTTTEMPTINTSNSTVNTTNDTDAI